MSPTATETAIATFPANEPAAQGLTVSTETKKRVRTGCYNCRRKHKKCDEQHPVCKACILKNEKCEWPLPKKPTRRRRATATSVVPILPSPVDTALLDKYSKNLENIAHNSIKEDGTVKINSNNVFNERNGSIASIPSNIGAESMVHAELTPSPTSSTTAANNQNTNNMFNASISNDIYGDLQSTLRDYMFANASNYASTEDLQDLNLEQFDINNIFETNRIFDGSTSPSENIPFLSQVEEKNLLKNYLYKIAPWIDMFDITRQFGLQSLQFAKEHQGLRYAIYALSSRQIERTDPTYPPSKTIALYQNSLKHLIPTVKKTPDLPTITACVLLCVFEMMSISPEKWRHHLEGCSALFKGAQINGFSDQYKRALFWAFARMDVNSAVIGEENTMIECSKWLPPGISIYNASVLFKKENSLDMYANYIIFLSSRVLNLISTSDIRNFDKEWELLWNEVNDWHSERPEQMKPIFEFDSSPFPGVLYDNGPASKRCVFIMSILSSDLLTEIFSICKSNVSYGHVAIDGE